MHLIKRLPTRKRSSGGIVSWGLFLCTLCNKEVEKPLSQGKYNASCGCQGRGRSVDSKILKILGIETEYNEGEINEIAKTNTEEKLRGCLMCNKMFKSKGRHNWRCKKCEDKVKQGEEGLFYTPPIHKRFKGSMCDAIEMDY